MKPPVTYIALREAFFCFPELQTEINMTKDIDHIYNMDCLEGMREIPDGAIDCIICDLPYNTLHRSNPNTAWDKAIPMQPLWEQYRRVIKDNGAIILFAQNKFSAHLIIAAEDIYRYSLVWDKRRTTGFLNANRQPLRQHEDILVFYKKLPTYNPQMTEGTPSHPRGNGKHKNNNNCYGNYGVKNNRVYDKVRKTDPSRPGQKFPTSIISIPKEHETTVLHPTQKPVELLRYLIRTYTDVGGVILDNCMGSGTTAVAAILEHRHFIGFETNPDFFGIAQERIMTMLK